MQRAVLTAIVLAVFGWMGYWWYASDRLDEELNGWFEERRAEGWAADASMIQTQGFPFRFNTDMRDVRLADPDTGLGWAADRFLLMAMAYRPNKIIALWPQTQEVFTLFGRGTITSDEMRASLWVNPGAGLELNEAIFDFKAAAYSFDAAPALTAGSGIAALRKTASKINTYDIYVAANDVVPGDALKQIIDPNGRLPQAFETATIDIQARFDRPWDRFAIESARPQPKAINIRRVEARWGVLGLHLAGTLDVQAGGILDGDVAIKVTEWEMLLQIGVENGLLPQGLADTLHRVMSGLAQASGPSNTIDVPLSIDNGTVKLGFLPLGDAPRVVLR
ncbi:MAG: DUF2125 domain-containing protein [Planktomarina sp.]